MRRIIVNILLVLLTQATYGQSFVKAYKNYRLNSTDTLSSHKTSRKMASFIKSQIAGLDTVFRAYKARNNFDFDTADTLFLIYESPAESPFTSDIIIWSGKDTISYRQGFQMIKPFKFKRTATHGTFITRGAGAKGAEVTTERDSIVALVAKRDYGTIRHLGDNQNINDGSYYKIYVAYKDNGRYKFETCFQNNS
jgi:hypothetical protein